MANVDEIEAQIEQTKMALKSLEAQLADEKSRGTDSAPNKTADDKGETGNPPSAEEAQKMMSEEESFTDSIESRMAEEKSPAEEVSEAEAAPSVDAVMVGIKMSDGEKERDMSELYNQVYDKAYDPNSAIDAEKMQMMKEAMEDPRVAKMAQEEPEKFALFMLGRRSK
tara:strand:- start:2292 stop:2795 length:504 start_codon:yes stop_codon:yes gene_type:complete